MRYSAAQKDAGRVTDKPLLVQVKNMPASNG